MPLLPYKQTDAVKIYQAQIFRQDIFRNHRNKETQNGLKIIRHQFTIRRSETLRRDEYNNSV